MAKTPPMPPWQHAVMVLTGTVIGVVVVCALYWAQVVFIPLALAIFFAFVLSPPVKLLQRRGLGRIPSVLVVVLLAVLALGGLGWVLARQIGAVLEDLPNHAPNIKARIKFLQELGTGSGRLEEMVDEIGGQLKGKSGRAPTPPRPEQPPAVVVRPESPPWLGQLPGYLRPAIEGLGGLALAVVLTIFMLVKSEDLRNRFIRLAGRGQVTTTTTKAVDEAGQRVSRYLFMQLIVNAAYGLALALGLFLVGIDHALLWGPLAAALRYVPYIGAWIAAALLVVLSLALFPGWLQPLLVLGVIVALEMVTSNVVEPWLYGHSLGVSEVALLVAAAFWAYLWGPIGLVLSGPLTVCVVILGKYVRQLQFLDVLLGDAPALEPHVTYYQRLLARDQDEAAGLVLDQVKTEGPANVYDSLLVPGLNYAKRDRDRDGVTEADNQFVLRATREIVEDLGERQAVAAREASGPAGAAAAAAPKTRLLGCPGEDEADALALEMLRQILDPARWEVEILSAEVLAAELVELARAKDAAVVCVGALPPGGLAHARYLCKRLRRCLPDAHIVVGRWGLRGNVEQNEEQLRQAGADRVLTTLAQTRDYLHAWQPVLAQEELQEAAGLR